MIITNNIGEEHDKQTKSVFKGTCYDHGTHFSNWEVQSHTENTAAVSEALEARELIKISVLQNCMDDPREIAEVLAERTHSQVVQVIGKKIVLYKEGKDKKKKIFLP